MGTFTKRLLKRKLAKTSTLMSEDLRKLGLVFIGGGFLALLVDKKAAGLWAGFIGVGLSFFGLTEPKDEE